MASTGSVDIQSGIMLATVDFDDQSHFLAKEINDVSKTRMLAPEFRFRYLLTA